MTLITYTFPKCNECDTYYSDYLDCHYNEYRMRKHMRESGWKSRDMVGTCGTHDVCPDCVKKDSHDE